MRALCFLAPLILVLIQAQDDEETAVLEAMKKCADRIGPSEDDLDMISAGELKSNNATAMITCLFKDSGVMREKSVQKDKTVVFLRALVAGDDSTKMDLFKRMSEKCASVVSKMPNKENASEEEVAVTIYSCLVKEGKANDISIDTDTPDNSTSAT